MLKVLGAICGQNPGRLSINNDEIVWQELWELALRHRVGSVLIDHLKQIKVEVPDDIARLMSDYQELNAYNGMKNSVELIRITKLFQKQDLPFISFKGLAFNQLTGLELTHRHNGDIDILLVNYNDVIKADEQLKEMGYQRITLPKTLALNTKQNKHVLNYEKDFSYIHPRTRINIELHFKLFNSYKMFPLSVQEIYRNRSEIKIGTTVIPVMCKEDHLLYLLVHGAVCQWFRLKWLCDIPLVSNNGQDYMSHDLWLKAKSLGIERMVAQGLWLAHELLNMPISSEVYEYQQDSLIVQRLIKQAKKQMNKKIPHYKNLPEKVEYWSSYIFWYMPSLKQNINYKKSHIRSYFMRVSDWQVLSLPSSLFWLYYPLRPLLWLRRQFKFHT